MHEGLQLITLFKERGNRPTPILPCLNLPNCRAEQLVPTKQSTERSGGAEAFSFGAAAHDCLSLSPLLIPFAARLSSLTP